MTSWAGPGNHTRSHSRGTPPLPGGVARRWPGSQRTETAWVAALSCEAGSSVCSEETDGDALSPEVWEGGRGSAANSFRTGLAGHPPGKPPGDSAASRTLLPQSYAIGPLATNLKQVLHLGPWVAWTHSVSHQSRGWPPSHPSGLRSQSLGQSVQQVEDVALLNFV